MEQAAETISSTSTPGNSDEEIHPTAAPGAGRVRRRRSILGTLFGLVILVALSVLTYRQAFHSPALIRARESERRGDYVTACWSAMEHRASRPWSREAAGIAARCLSRLDHPAYAEPYYRRAGALSDQDRHVRAYGLVRANLRFMAIDAYETILADDPDDVSALQNLAGVLLSQARWDEVRALARRLIAMPDQPVTAYRPATAGAHWTLKPTRIESPPVIGWSLEAVACHNQRESTPAVAAFERILALDPDLRRTPLDRGLFWAQFAESLIRIGRTDDAIRHLTVASASRPDPRFLELLGEAHEQRSDFDAAERSWSQLLERDSNSFRARFNLGRLLSRRGRDREAAEMLEEARRLEPSSQQLLYNLALVYRRLGQDEKARETQEQAQRLREKASPNEDAPTNPSDAVHP